MGKRRILDGPSVTVRCDQGDMALRSREVSETGKAKAGSGKTRNLIGKKCAVSSDTCVGCRGKGHS